MKTNQRGFVVRTSVAIARFALIAMALASGVYAADAAPPDDRVNELTRPTNSVEAGVGYVNQDSFKFGQYNGLFNKGAYGLFNFYLGGGAPYDSDSTTRWRAWGTDLGLDDRTIYGEYGDQGTFRIWGVYDQLRSNYGTGDKYQTPFNGAGSNALTLPPNWVKPVVPQVSATAGNFRALSPITGLANSLVSGVSTPPTAAQQAQVANIIANDVPAFHNVDLDVTRKLYGGGVGLNFGPRWVFAASATQTKQDGLKPLAMINLSSGTVSTVLPNVIDTTTNQYNASLTYKDERFFASALYYGSYFTNNVSSMTWESAFSPGTFATLSSAPSNEFNQFTLKGGYNFSPTAKLVAGFSYGRNTQNQSFLSDPTDLPLSTPVSSLNGTVDTTQFNVRFSDRPAKDFTYNIGYRYLDRDNKTPINIYEFYDAGEPPGGTASYFNSTLIALGLAPAGTKLASNINIYANRPYSRKTNLVNVDAAYAIASGQSLKAAYQYEQIDRTCPGSWIDCADADKARTNSINVAWDATMVDSVNGRVSYEYAQRRVDYNPNAWLALVPMANYLPVGTAATTGAADFLNQTGLGGYGPIAPYTPLQPGNLGVFFPNNSAMPQALYGSRNDIHEIPGMERYYAADRNRNKVRGAINWEATNEFSLQGNVEYTDDDYKSSIYGLQNEKQLMANIEANWALNENFNANLFYTYEEQRQKSAGLSYSAGQITNTDNVNGSMGVSGGCFLTVLEKNANAKIDPCLNWSADMKNKINTVGLRFDWKGLLDGKLELIGNALYSDARIDNGMTGGTYANNPYAVAGKPPVSPAVYFIPAQNLPTVTQKMIELQIAAQYSIDKHSSLRAFYWWQKLDVTDYMYDGMQYGTITSVMPTNETAPNYNVSVVGISYVYRWQ